jgi:alkanesulfonate monooxygenase SsuD/methylene tetrahydromethanopterin reductase-like flavin-dependent oxidoreductase (luciferase family)
VDTAPHGPRPCRPGGNPETAARHAAWADGLITVNQSTDTLQRVLESYRAAGGRGPARLQIHLSWAPTEEEAVAIAHDQWRSNIFAPPVCWDLETVDAFDVISKDVTPEQVNQSVRVSSDLAQHVAWLAEYIDQGWDELYLHFVGQQQASFIDAFGEHVLPQLSPTAPQPRAAIA